RVAVVKPDWGFRGGGEVAVDHVERILEADGHQIARHRVSVPGLPRSAFGLDIPDPVWQTAPEYFRHLVTLDAMQGLSAEVAGADLVLSTQPPSYAVDHPRHLSLFFHHLRVFYDLCDLYLRAGFVEQPEL